MENVPDVDKVQSLFNAVLKLQFSTCDLHETVKILVNYTLEPSQNTKSIPVFLNHLL